MWKMRWSQHACRANVRGLESHGLPPADARRIVAALNAGHNIPTSLLEHGLVQRLVANHVSELDPDLDASFTLTLPS